MTDNNQEEEFDVEKEEQKQAEKQAEESNEEEAAPSPEEIIEKLKADMAAKDEEAKQYRERAEKAEKERGESAVTATNAQEQALQLHEQKISNDIDTENTRIESIERKLEEAQTTGDVKAMVAAQRELSKATVALANAENAKQQFESWKQQQAAQPKRQSGYTPETQKWINEHPQFTSDPTYRAEALAADSAAQSLGYAPDTTAYFNFINDRLDRAFDKKPEAQEQQSSPRQKKVIPSAAPSRESASGNIVRSFKDIQLTAEQKEAAEISGISEEDYKKNLYTIKQQKGR